MRLSTPILVSKWEEPGKHRNSSQLFRLDREFQSTLPEGNRDPEHHVQGGNASSEVHLWISSYEVTHTIESISRARDLAGGDAIGC